MTPNTTRHPQLALPVTLRADARLSSLFAGPNAWLIDWLQSTWCSGSENSLFLHGVHGSGLTQWLQAICQQSEEQGSSGFYLNLTEVRDESPAVLLELAGTPLVCLDDVDTVLGQQEWDQQLFHLFNAQKDQGLQLVLAAHCSLPELADRMLADLHSRLSWGMRAQLKLPEDDDWTAAITWLAAQYGLTLSHEAALYIAYRGPREWQGLNALLQRLDTESLVAQRKLTPPFIKSVMQW
ncbi:DnaA ATPase domain-containing protein [Salinispirillum marinum]|uniref:DnaA ATPase domain-containing protein n=2 Tax=Saccharospirillaceae TaxID=255527 RepID=A0ABV8BI33_9GAMM